MINPLTLMSLLSSAGSAVGSVASGVASVIGGDNGSTSDTNNSSADFTNLLEGSVQNTSQNASTGANASAATTQTGIIPQSPLNIGAGSLFASQAQESISEQTVNAINQILASNNPNDLSALTPEAADAANSALQQNVAASTDDTTTNTDAKTSPSGVLAQGSGKKIIDDKQLDDPFGIKAAQAAGSPIAILQPVNPIDAITAADTTDTGLDDLITTIANATAGKTDGTDTTSAQAKADAAVVAGTQTATAETNKINLDQVNDGNINVADKSQLKDKITSLADKTDNDAVQKLAASTNTQATKAADDSKLTTATDKVADKVSVTAQTNNPTAAIINNQFDNTRISTADIRSKEDLKEKLENIDTYKVVNVSRKDNILNIKLDPEQLGKVQIKLDFGADGKATIAVTADKQQTLDMLQKDTKSIEKILSDNGVKAESGSLSFNLNGGSEQKQQNAEGFNFFNDRPLSFRVQEEVSKLATNDNGVNNVNYMNYNAAGQTGMLNIIV